MEKRCAACGQAFEPNPRIRQQAYCPNPMCQRERRRHWQQQKRRDDADYRDNDGVAPERLAKALNVDISLIHKKVSLLDGICPEAVEMLKDQHFAANLGSVLRKLKPTRQVECVELMLTANNMTVAYAAALLAATPPHLLVSEKRPQKISGVTAEQMVKMEREMGNIQGQLKLVEKSYGQDVLLLVLARGYLGKLIDNKAVFRFLSQRQPDVLAEFENIVQTVALEGK